MITTVTPPKSGISKARKNDERLSDGTDIPDSVLSATLFP